MKKNIAILICSITMIFNITDVKAENIVEGFKYNENQTAANYCITGEEETCEKTMCYNNENVESCTPGTIIKYKVNDSEEKYFHVIKDDGETLTMQQRENTVNKVAWHLEGVDNTIGPLTVLAAIENATNGWTNVNDQTYTLGKTNFAGTENGEYTGCNTTPYYECLSNRYTLPQRTAKARIISMQEAHNLGCTSTDKSCPKWMNNYLNRATGYGGTKSGVDDGYWMLQTLYDDCAYIVDEQGSIYVNYVYNNSTRGARAVVVISKIKQPKDKDEQSEESPSIDNSNKIKGQTINLEDTKKSVLLIYIIGTIILISGITVLLFIYKKKLKIGK